MTRKLLTALDQIAERTATTLTIVTSGQQQLALTRETALETAKHIQTVTTLPILNVQRLMTEIHLIEMTKLLPMLTPKEILRNISGMLIPSAEEETAVRRRTLPYRQMQELETERVERLRPEKVRQEIREIVLSRTSINLIDQTAFARLETWLWTHFPLQTMQILGELLEQALRKSWYLDRLVGLEPLEKLMLQMYLYAFMEFPLQMNLLGMRVTPLTMTVLRGRVASIYETYAVENEALAQKWQLISALARKQETKALIRTKGKQEIVPLKEGIGVTSDLEDDTIVSTGKDMMGKEWFFIAMRYAYSLPFWLRRRLVKNFGMPENHKYARYFGIGCIPTRYAKYSWKYRRYSEENFTYFRRDEWLKTFHNPRKHFSVGVSFKKRYGGFRFFHKL